MELPNKILLISFFFISLIYSQDISGNYKLSGLSAVYYDFLRQESSVTITDNYGIGITAIGDTYEQGEAIQYEYQSPTPEVFLNSAGVQLYVNFYTDGSAAIAQGSTYPTSTTEDCISSLSTLPITGDQGYSSNLNSEVTIPEIDIVGLPTKSIYSGQSAGSCSITSSPVFDVFPQIPTEVTIPFPINTSSISQGLGELIPANTVLPGQTAGYALSSNKLVSTIEQNTDIRPSLYLEWHAIDGPVNNSGLGDIIGEDEDGDGTDYDRIYGLETIRAMYNTNLTEFTCGTWNYPIAGRNVIGLQSIKEQQCLSETLDSDCVTYAESWIDNCIDKNQTTATGNDVGNLYAFDSNASSSLWGGIITWNSINAIEIDDSDVDFIESCLDDGDNSDCAGRLSFSYIPQCLPSFTVRLFMAELTELCDLSEQDECGVCGGDGPVTWYNDADRDGLGDPNNYKTNCLPGYCIQNESLTYTECGDVGNTWDWLSMGICSDGNGTVYENLNPNLGDFEFCNYIIDNVVPGYENASWVWDRGFSTNNFDDDDTCESTLELDECGVCGGDNSTCLDCADVPNGESLLDECGTCDTDSTNDCVQDCTNIWGGSLVDDECGVCGGNNSTCADCANVPNGESLLDECDTCDADSTNDCVQDCANIWGGSLVDDECGVCGGDDSTCTDCNGVVNGLAITDGCGDCVGGDTGADACPTDCNGVDGGVAFIDDCFACVDPGDTSCIEGCDGTYANDGTQLVEDDCGICSNVPNYTAGTCHDCADVPNGKSLLDDCDACVEPGDTSCIEGCDGTYANDGTQPVDDECFVCGGDNSTCTDCAGVLFGDSWDSDCGCVGVENTGNNCDDCSEVPNGTSMNDECEFCNEPVCNNYGIPSPFTAGNNPCNEGSFPTSTLWNTSCTDCSGIPNGTAYENLITGECELILSTDDLIPNQFLINKIYPNPFNPVLTISYGIPTSQYTEGHIYNLSGKLVHTLISQYQSAGNYSLKWNATGKPSGIYIFILKTESEVKSQKLILLK